MEQAKRGFGAAKEVKAAMDATRGAGGYALNLIIKDGDIIDLVFNGSVDEPLIGYEHSFKEGQKFGTQWCASGHEGHAGCVCCYYNARGDKRFGGKSAKGVFNVVDMRWIHKIKNEVKSRSAGEGKERFDYFPCTDDISCKLCKQKIARERSGQKVWKLSMQWVQALGGLNDSLGKRCMCGGKISLVGYKNYKGKIVGEIPDGADEAAFEKLVECSKCGEEANPRSIFNTIITVTRTGGGTDTSYNFQPQKDDEIPAWITDGEGTMKAPEPYDLDKVVLPTDQMKVAGNMGVEYPFANQVAAAKTKPHQGGLFDDDELVSATRGQVPRVVLQVDGPSPTLPYLEAHLGTWPLVFFLVEKWGEHSKGDCNDIPSKEAAGTADAGSRWRDHGGHAGGV